MKCPLDLVAVDERRTALEKALNLIPQEHRSKEAVVSLSHALLKEEGPDVIRPLTDIEQRAFGVIKICLTDGQSVERCLQTLAMNFPSLVDWAADYAEDIGIDISKWQIAGLRKLHPIYERAIIPVPALKVEHAAKLESALVTLSLLSDDDTPIRGL